MKEIKQKREAVYSCPVKAILFDMDNTLFDFVAAKLEACRKILSYIGNGKSAQSPSELFNYFLRGIYGFEDYENIKDYMQERNFYTPAGYGECCRIYEREKLQNLVLYPGVKETLIKLKESDFKLGIITDANHYHASARLSKVKLLEYFNPVVAADMTGTKKPDPAHFLFALKSLEIKPEESLVVGDSIRRDMMPARELGFKTAYASYGDWRPSENTDMCFDFKLDTFSDVLECIKALNRN
jgi:putative hydrolase of the HAD superfamily